MLRHPKRSAIKVIDFGSSCFLNEKMYKYIQSRFYRAPEVILELEYDHAIDIWSLGCILVELYNGEPLFPGENEKDQLKLIIDVLGYPPLELINHSPKALKFFTQGPKGEAILKKSKKTKRENQNPNFSKRNLDEVIKFNNKGNEDPNELINFMNFRSLVFKMLKIDPSQRINASDALRHEFFTMRSNDFNLPSSNNLSSSNGFNLSKENNPPLTKDIINNQFIQKNSPKFRLNDDMDTSMSPQNGNF